MAVKRHNELVHGSRLGTVSPCTGLIAVLLVALAVSPVFAENRAALVIGNGAYPSGPLEQPIADARAVADAFGALGFEVVAGYDLTRGGMERHRATFGALADQADVVAFYYSGHALQAEGANYLVPVDALPIAEVDPELELIPLNGFIDALGHAGRLGIAILEAGRTYPPLESLAAEPSASGLKEGLALVEVLPGHTLVAYATETNQLVPASEGHRSRYTAALIGCLDLNLDIRLVLGQVRDTVITETEGAQTPFSYGSLGGDLWAFNPDEAMIAANEAAASSRPGVKVHASTLDPRCYQEGLKALGYYDGAIDGIIGRRSKAAIAAFQSEHGFVPTGELTEAQRIALIRAAAEAGDAKSQYTFGLMAAQGIGLPEDVETAVHWLEAAAEQDDPAGLYRLGMFYRDGHGVDASASKARAYLERALASGHPDAAAALKAIATDQ